MISSNLSTSKHMMNNTFRFNQVSGSFEKLIADELKMNEMRSDDINWLVFEYNAEKKQLSCYNGYVEKKCWIKDIACEVMQYLPRGVRLGEALSLYAPGAYESRADICWGLKQDVLEFRKNLAAKLLEGI